MLANLIRNLSLRKAFADGCSSDSPIRRIAFLFGYRGLHGPHKIRGVLREHDEEVEGRPIVAYYPVASMGKVPRRPKPNKKKQSYGPLEMSSLLKNMDALAALQLDE
ncbi:hypothetical protein Fot_37554 [Forsythia ovata]|uniref:Uncharacterized protein n=1 Tax=Forsythia ovata TaxID=205694 RepID=A0ABD1RZB0_9LAMI